MIGIDEKIKLPKIESALCDGYYIYINPINGQNFITDENGSKVIELLKEKETLAAVLETMQKDKTCTVKPQDAIKTLMKLDSKEMLNGKVIKDERIKEEYPSYFHIHLTNYCNYSCRHCYMAANLNIDTSNELNYEALEHCIKEYIDFPRNNKECFINFSGGEATKSKYFVDLLKFSKEYAEDKGVKLNDCLITNGSSFVDKEFIELIKHYMDRVHISVDGCTEEMFDYIRGKGNYKKTITGINNAIRQGLNVAINITLMRSNVEDFTNNFEKLLDKLEDVDKVTFIISKAFASGRADEKIVLSDDEFFNAKALMLRKIKKDKTIYKTVNEPIRETCGFGGAIVLYPNGDIKYCVPYKMYNDINAGNIHESKFKDIINEKMKTKLINTCVDKLEECHDCPVKYICGGGCRLDNLYFNHSEEKVYCEGNYKIRSYKESLRKLLYEYILEEDDVENDFTDNRFVMISDGWKL